MGTKLHLIPATHTQHLVTQQHSTVALGLSIWQIQNSEKSRLLPPLASLLRLLSGQVSGNPKMSFAICHIIWAPCLKGGGTVANWEKSQPRFLLDTFLKQYTSLKKLQSILILSTPTADGKSHTRWPEKKTFRRDPSDFLCFKQNSIDTMYKSWNFSLPCIP